MATALGQATTRAQSGRRGTAREPRASALGVIAGAGLVAGTLDIAEALIFSEFHGVTPAMVFRYIASGLIGARAARSGPVPVGVGVILHYAIAFSWTALFYAASRRLPVMTRRPVLCGLVYGGFVYLCMSGIVLPVAGLPPAWASADAASILNGVLAILLCIGLPISLLVRRRSLTT
jgi:hypothetical protein